MEWLILIIIIIAYFDLSSKIKKINQNFSKKKDVSILKSMIGKKIEIEIDDDYNLVFGSKINGILKKYNDVWLVLEVVKKQEKSLIYFRIKNIKSIEEIK